MSRITVVCEGCGSTVDGLIDTATTPDGEALILSGGFYLREEGAVCDDCAEA